MVLTSSTASVMSKAVVNPGLVLGPALEADFGSSLEVLVKLMRGDFPLLPRLGFRVRVRDGVRSLLDLGAVAP